MVVMEDSVTINGVTDVNGKNGDVYYELNDGGDTDSMTPGNNIDSHDGKYFIIFYLFSII